MTRTRAWGPLLRRQPEIAGMRLPMMLQRQDDQLFRPLGEKAAITPGMGMTEKQGGTDVRANTTAARPAAAAGPGQEYLLVGHQWFLSPPMCACFLLLPPAAAVHSCFFVPPFLPDGTVHALSLQRLTAQLGTRAHASAHAQLQYPST